MGIWNYVRHYFFYEMAQIIYFEDIFNKRILDKYYIIPISGSFFL